LIKQFNQFSDHRSAVVLTIHSNNDYNGSFFYLKRCGQTAQQLKIANRENRIKDTVRAEHTLML